ncbi:glycosyltransferase [Streptomyces tanashiensis]|uniref:Glycosyltransferase n=1 Tax=Streptomyces tanashiensis TaxID=67367 RepID=A0ABY6R7S7_9ACTN|nr:glycosyltransferase [Streptomyces tanashiensis]UZX26135.1 glycosyltransferase [Streptomyces tanashiensis]
MSSNEGIVVLTTREKEWWLSLQEIIPAIERVWDRIGRSDRKTVSTLCVPLPPEMEKRLHARASRLDRIVLTTVTPGTVKAALLLRAQTEESAPMTLYVHGDGPEGFEAFGALVDVLTERDTFVVTCEAEAVTVRSCFPKAQVELIPFPLVDLFKVNSGKRRTKDEITRLAYVGRVSEQKNLHNLLFALWIMRTSYAWAPTVTLDVYGGEDDLGSPNMGLKYPDYGTYLRRLAETLGLDDVVTWHGAKPRDWVFYDVHQEPHILVSPTLHSDENFGSSVLASLANGHQVVTTSWGGHRGFQEWFPQQLTLVPVHASTLGPVVDPVALAGAIVAAVERSSTVVEEAAIERGRAAFSEGAVTVRTLEMLSRPDRAPVPLKKSPIQQHIDEHRVLFGGARRIYAGYEDPVAQIFFQAYGMEKPLRFDERSGYALAPWVSYSDNVVSIVDPHRGHRSFNVDEEVSTPCDVTMIPSMKTCRLPESLVKKLVAQGYAFSLESKG